jgi:hypothetical protein
MAKEFCFSGIHYSTVLGAMAIADYVISLFSSFLDTVKLSLGRMGWDIALRKTLALPLARHLYYAFGWPGDWLSFGVASAWHEMSRRGLWTWSFDGILGLVEMAKGSYTMLRYAISRF